MDACIEAEIQIPDQVAVLGVDNDPVICDCVQVPLSSVQHDLEGMAYEAAALLDRLINGEPPPKIHRRISPKGVATRSGFVNLNHFFRVFHARTAVTPRAFRLARQRVH